jgi:hypothetical protein
MKFVKDNLTLVICGAVLVLALAWAFVPGVPGAGPALIGAVRAEIQQRYDSRDAIEQLAKMPVSLPGIEGTGVPPQPWIDAKNALIQDMQKQRKSVDDAAANFNKINRFDGKDPLLPLPNGQNNPAAIKGTPMPNCLPTAKNPWDFKDAVNKLYVQWVGLLAFDDPAKIEKERAADSLLKAKPPTDWTTPPRADDVKTDFEKKNAPVAGGAGGFAGGGGIVADPMALAKELKRVATQRATGLRMYVEPTAFQSRQWLVGENPPRDDEVFNGFVESWFQSDVVKAIVNVNHEALARETTRNVGKAAVKRLSRITVGIGARNRMLGTVQGVGGGGMAMGGGPQAAAASDPGPLFLTLSNAAGAAQGGGMGLTPVLVAPVPGVSQPAPDAPAAPNDIKYELGMTGRFAGADYDVVPMSVIMDIDPAYLERFIDQLYRQNMSYTVTNIQFRTVDPLDRAGNGYLYGDSQVVEVELQMEGILFRSWTLPLMPKDIKDSLNIATKAVQ